ncbi:hypothetical protein DMA11_13240 [Marinilabiliaceae bacterium JC017]|nr:hypothetical protein DMA11_13240 [Marinilabiliaceae bacterium JC017]
MKTKNLTNTFFFLFTALVISFVFALLHLGLINTSFYELGRVTEGMFKQSVLPLVLIAILFREMKRVKNSFLFLYAVLIITSFFTIVDHGLINTSSYEIGRSVGVMFRHFVIPLVVTSVAFRELKREIQRRML